MSDREYRTLLEARKAPAPEIASAGERDIILAAIEVFGEKGYAASGLREIAERASVTAPLIGYHFGNKEGLYLRCIDAVLGALAESALEAVARDDGIVDAVRRFARAHVDFSREHPKALRFAMGMAYGPADRQPTVEWSSHYLAMFEWASRRFEQAIADGELQLRPGSELGWILRHLFHIVHLEIFATFERMRYADQLVHFEEHVTCEPLEPERAAEDIVQQFFHGAGEVKPDAF